MKLTILGSGTVDPQPHRACSGYYLQSSAGGILMDLGNAALRQAVRSRLPVEKTDKLFISHLHPDHTADIVPFLFARNYAPPPWDEVPDLTVFGPPGMKEFMQSLYAPWPSIAPKEGQPGVWVEEFPEGGGAFYATAEFEATAVPVEHGDMKAYGFRLRDGESVLAYSGDTSLCEGVKRVARDAALFICECSCFPRGQEPLHCRTVHLSWEDVAEVCRESSARELVITHLYEPVLGSKPHESLSQALDIPVHLAEDGATYQL